MTLGVTVNAAGNMVPPWVVFTGKRNLATTKVNLPENGRSGVWQFSYTVNGWVDRKSMVAFIQDIGDFLAREDIPRPVLLFMDGAKCHLSLEIAQLCTKLNVQPILLRPNTTHLTQPLDLTYFQSFKAELQKEKEAWHRQNVGISLSKYAIIPLAYRVTERILDEKPTVIPNGFRSGGICPWDPSAPTGARMDPSHIYEVVDSSHRQSTVESQVGSSSMPSCLGGSSAEFSSEAGSSTGLSQAISSPLVGNVSNQIDTSPMISQEDSSGLFLPESNQHFLSWFELLLSEQELSSFNFLYKSGNFTEPNLPYQSWLVMKRGLEPVVEREAVEQVLVSHTPKKVPKGLKRGGPKQPDGPSRYIKYHLK